MAAITETRTIRLLEAVPELGGALEGEELEQALRHCVVGVADLRPGSWAPSRDAQLGPGHLGLLVVDGFVTRDVRVGQSVSCELCGRGDLLRPSDHDGEAAPVPFAVQWRVLEPTRLAILDRRATAVLGRWPEVVEAIVARCVERSRSLGFHLAVTHLRRVEPRLQAMLWHLADRWGKVTPDGIHVPLRFTHQTLGQLVGAQRPSVTTALKALAEAGLVSRCADGSWMLHGEPPDIRAELDGDPSRRELVG